MPPRRKPPTFANLYNGMFGHRPPPSEPTALPTEAAVPSNPVEDPAQRSSQSRISVTLDELRASEEKGRTWKGIPVKTSQRNAAKTDEKKQATVDKKELRETAQREVDARKVKLDGKRAEAIANQASADANRKAKKLSGAAKRAEQVNWISTPQADVDAVAEELEKACGDDWSHFAVVWEAIKNNPEYRRELMAHHQ
jgi:hypothetical protein